MKLASLQHVYRHPGPFATVYLDTFTNAADGLGAIVDRWHRARQRLIEQGADADVVRVIDEHVGEHGAEIGPREQVLVANSGGVLLNDELPKPEREPVEDAYFGPVPQLMPYLRLRGPHIPHVLAVLDEAGADLTVVHPIRMSETSSVFSDESAPLDVSRVADEITEAAHRSHARAVVLAGEQRYRTWVHQRLPDDIQDRVVETDTGARDRRSSEQALRTEVAETVRAAVEARIAETVREFEQERHGVRVVEGWESTMDGLRKEQLRALLWTSSERGRPETVYIGPGPSQLATTEAMLRESGVNQISAVPADAAIIRALASAGGEFFPVDPRHIELTEGIAGIRRA